MTKNNPPREQFDRERSFVTRSQIRINGQDFAPGDPFDKFQVTTRRLRQLFEQRKLSMDPAVPVMEAGPARPDFASLPDEAILSWLQTQGVVPRFGSSHDHLVERATAEWVRQEALTISSGIPQEWLKLKWFQLRKKVGEVTGTFPTNKTHALELMQAHTG